jgi:hypothetical protein
MAATKTGRKPAKSDGHSPVDYLQGAIDELDNARDRARGDIRQGIDALEKAGDDVRRELGILAVRAQRSPEALKEMSAEIRKRKTELTSSK